MNMAGSASSSSAVRLLKKYDVFLSFRVEEIHKSFVSHLYAGLRRENIEPFIGRECIKEGENILPQLLTAVEESKISIIIFSENYADSTWCLEELVRIIQCRQLKGQIVVPVFYRTNPSVIRKQAGSYSLERLRSMGREQAYGPALEVAANLCGWDSSNVGNDAILVESIIKDILDKRIPSNLNISIYSLGYDVCREYLSVFLQEGSNDVLVVGIGGEAKMGKTVIAKAIYDGIFWSFDGSSFLIGVGQKSKEPNGMVKLQEKLLFDLLGEMIYITSVIQGVNVMRQRLCHKKVLIVLDDVDDLPQLFALVGSRKWFGVGSKIIITSRDLPLLRVFEVDQLLMAQGNPLPHDILEILEPYQQSCRKIAGLKEYIQSFSYLINEKVEYLEECLIRERRKGAIQKQIICELQHGQGEGHASNSCTMLEEVGTTSGPKSEKERLASSTGSQGNNNGIMIGGRVRLCSSWLLRSVFLVFVCCCVYCVRVCSCSRVEYFAYCVSGLLTGL